MAKFVKCFTTTMFIVDYANYKFMNVYVKILISVDLTALTKKKVITL